MVAQIKRSESKSRSAREALERADLQKQVQLSKSNQKLAVKLFSQKPTYRVKQFEKDHAAHEARVSRMSRFTRIPIMRSIDPSLHNPLATQHSSYGFQTRAASKTRLPDI